STTEDHLVDGVVYRGLLDFAITAHFKLKLSGAAHQLFDERGAGALCPAHDHLQEPFRELQTTRIELDQLGAALLIRQRKFNRLVNSSGARSQRRLKLIRTVGGEDEEHVGIFAKAIHFIQELIEQDLFARASHLLSCPGDQVHVLNYHQRRLQKPG